MFCRLQPASIFRKIVEVLESHLKTLSHESEDE
jgi:hypothetical protein